MKLELLINLSNLFSAIVCVAIIALVIWQNATYKHHSNFLIALFVIVLALLIWQINSTTPIASFIQFFILLLLFYQILKGIKINKAKSVHEHNKDISTLLISQAKEQERSRIYANLHDDVGAKLLELIYSAQDDKTKNLAKQVLSTIRQAVASTVNIQSTSQRLIDEILEESRLRLDSANIHMSKDTSFKQKEQKLPANVPSVISRIIREVVSNILKHSNAQTVHFTVSSDEKNLLLTIKDNGTGFIDEFKRKGKGLKTIQKRAAAISTEVKWLTKTNQGTTFILNYPYGH